jgi:hypothetical protein
MVVCPSTAIDPVRAVAISELSEFTAADEIVVFGTKALCGRLYDPLPFLGMIVLLNF